VEVAGTFDYRGRRGERTHLTERHDDRIPGGERACRRRQEENGYHKLHEPLGCFDGGGRRNGDFLNGGPTMRGAKFHFFAKGNE
jgi:hypothetical protein